MVTQFAHDSDTFKQLARDNLVITAVKSEPQANPWRKEWGFFEYYSLSLRWNFFTVNAFVTGIPQIFVPSIYFLALRFRPFDPLSCLRRYGKNPSFKANQLVIVSKWGSWFSVCFPELCKPFENEARCCITEAFLRSVWIFPSAEQKVVVCGSACMKMLGYPYVFCAFALTPRS